MRLNKKGITLIELIIAMSLLSVALVAAYAIFSSGMRSYQREVGTSGNQFNVRHASSYIGREIRRAHQVEVSGNVLSVKDSVGNTDVYQLQSSTITKNGNRLIDDIQTFNVNLSDGKITLYIKSKENSAGETFELTSEIIIRK